MNWWTLALISALFSAIAAILQKKTLSNMGAFYFSFLVSICSVLFCIPFAGLINMTQVSHISLIVLFGKTILTTFAFWLVMSSLKNLQISIALPLMVLTPGLVAICGFLFLDEQLSQQQILGMITLILGIYLLELEDETKIFSPFQILWQSKQHRTVISALLLFTITSLLDKILLVKFKLPPYAFLVFQQIFSVVIFSAILPFIIHYQHEKDSKKIRQLFYENWILIILIALCTLIYRYTQIEATKIASVALVLSVKRISVFFSTILGGTIFREQNLLRKTIAVVILLSGATLIFGRE